MSEQNDANSQNNSGAGSSSADQNVNGDNGQNSSAGTQNTVKVPFHEDPQIQDYISRQVEKRIEEKLQNVPQSVNVQKSEPDIVSKVSKRLGLNAEQAKDLVETFQEVNETINGSTKLAIQEMNYRNRLIELGNKYPDTIEIQKEMFDIYQKLDGPGKDFVLKNPEGLEFLYHKTKSIKGHYANSSFRNNGGSSRGSASGMNKSGDSSADLAHLAASAATSGDRKTYEEAAKKLFQNGGIKK